MNVINVPGKTSAVWRRCDCRACTWACPKPFDWHGLWRRCKQARPWGCKRHSFLPFPRKPYQHNPPVRDDWRVWWDWCFHGWTHVDDKGLLCVQSESKPARPSSHVRWDGKDDPRQQGSHQRISLHADNWSWERVWRLFELRPNQQIQRRRHCPHQSSQPSAHQRLKRCFYCDWGSNAKIQPLISQSSIQT